ncbi:pentapeptide repeat-containing protein [Campylobacter jejuni]|nr:pentapeptide repeat-containing protein [Campylobacter jejuni]BDL81777.1 hypothetical protein THJ028_00350 [Campylobacter jejuni]
MEEFDKEQAIADIAEKLNIQKDKISYIEHSDLFQINDCVIPVIADNIKVFQEYNLYFYRCTIPNLILEITTKSLEFKMCCFESSFIIRNNFDGYISIQDSIFEKDFGIFWVKKEIYKINVCKNIFKDVSIFENKILNFNFEENSIQNISICNNLFTKEAYFNANSFNYECIFFKNSFENLSFYEANFEKSFIFFQNIIKGNLNAINAKLNFTFSNLEEKIEQEYEEFNKNKKEEDQKSLDKFANDFRDSFRTFKSALIKDNNALDASNFHKYELYCKEIELKQNWDKKGENVKNTTDLEKNVSRIRDFMDFLLLGFYRKLCDHHTDFLKVFNNLILLIALYALFVSLYICLVYTKSLFFGRYVVLIFSYIVFIIMLIKQPNVIHPLIGKIANESDKFFNYPSLIVLNILYTILLALVLFSLQKTARKNSIVPS